MHARKTARDALFPSREDDAFFTPRRGDIVFRDGAAVRTFANRVNEGRLGPHSHLRRRYEEELRAPELAAMTLVHEVFHAVLGKYRDKHPDSLDRFEGSVEVMFGVDAPRTALDFLAVFPPPGVYRQFHGEGDSTPVRHLETNGGTTPPTNARPPLKSELDEELLLLWVTNQNPAYDPVRVIVGDQELGPRYKAFVSLAQSFFESEPAFGPKGETLVELLLAPARAHPTSIFAQLEYIERSWGESLGLNDLPLWNRLAWARDLKTEEDKWFSQSKAGPGPGDPLLETMRFGRREDEEPARFSPDRSWMPNVVLIAKSVYVWLDQLSRKYGKYIHRLDQIPDEELDRLASQHMTGLWLIGLFERSRASRKVKQMRGDTDALASAYSLKAYDIAEELGGVYAYENLKARAWARGIRLAADMVPNHVGIDGDWLIKHPDWFLQSRSPPFPAYRFGGPDLSEDQRVGVFIEEGYWHKTDAAVVFRRHDRVAREDRFIYHGNDGTSMPWNDTAQLDYLNAEVRHAVIETILHVARMFPIIRFDAAMTLAKRHIQRLWFPLPGQAGAIPSRSDYAMTQEQFDKAIPIEFWREVVDAVAERAPDTLLLAEAFWMMEGYFVRTLGMHRVYNSAFMNMLKREENDKYRATIKNVLDFDAEILKRFVNFMNNPDEETAVDQFGQDDKYFGVCVLMCTMPGLPMFGHGQIEGLHEKYGMEYRRARYDEGPNPHLVARHEREIFPLLDKRYLFSGVEHFALYDFVTDSGEVDEDVYAFSNGSGSERSLVLFNNKFKTTRGRIQHSTHRGKLGHELALDEDRGWWLIIRDMPHGREYLRPTKDIIDGGMAWDLDAFKYHVLTGFHPVTATLEKPYDRLAAELAGRGVPSIEHAVRELYLRPVHAPLREACAKPHLAYLTTQLDAKNDVASRAELEERLGHVADGLDWMLSRRTDRDVSIDRAEALRGAGDRFAMLHALVRAGATAPGGDDKQGDGVDAPAAPAAPAAAVNGGQASAANRELDIDLLLAWIQVEAVIDLVALAEPAVEDARSRPRVDSAEALAPLLLAPPDAEAVAPTLVTPTKKPLGGAAAAASVATPAPPVVSPSEQPTQPPLGKVPPQPTTWTRREALIGEWDLATPIVEAFGSRRNAEAARREAALVLLAATLPMGPIAPALRLALGTRRGQTFLNVHESGGVIWLRKERYEELTSFLAQREAASRHSSLEECHADAAALNDLALREGYRAERIASELGPPPPVDIPTARTTDPKLPASSTPAAGAPAAPPRRE